MDKDYQKGLKIGLGITTILLLLFGLIFAIGFHTADEILGGTFNGNYIFEDNVTFNGNINSNAEKLGQWNLTGYTVNVDYQAETDGFVLGHCDIATSDAYLYLYAYTSSNTSDYGSKKAGCTSRRSGGTVYAKTNSFLLPVKKGDYWKIVRSSSGTVYSDIYWIPLNN